MGWGRLRRSLVVTLAAALLAAAPAVAPPAALAKDGEWVIRLTPPSAKYLCIGETATITGTYAPNPAAGGVLAPLTGPDINVLATNGTVNPYWPVTGAAAGTFSFRYTASAAGRGHIEAYALQDESRTSLNIPIKETCTYRYTFNVDWMGTASAGGNSLGYGIKLHNSGTLKVTDPSRPLHLESNLRVIDEVWETAEFQIEGCVLNTPVLGRAKGILDVTAEIDPDTRDVEVVLAPPDLTMTFYQSWTCTSGDEAQTLMKSGAFDIGAERDPWVSARFPAAGGVKSVKVDSAERWTRNWRSGKGNIAGYTASLKLERIDK